VKIQLHEFLTSALVRAEW